MKAIPNVDIQGVCHTIELLQSALGKQAEQIKAAFSEVSDRVRITLGCSHHCMLNGVGLARFGARSVPRYSGGVQEGPVIGIYQKLYCSSGRSSTETKTQVNQRNLANISHKVASAAPQWKSIADQLDEYARSEK